jgi:hypothetical protein
MARIGQTWLRLNADGGPMVVSTGQRIEILILWRVRWRGVLVGGLLTFINGTNRYGSARLNADGSGRTLSFQQLQSDVEFLIPLTLPRRNRMAGLWRLFLCLYCNDELHHLRWLFVARVNANGSRDTGFEPAGKC